MNKLLGFKEFRTALLNAGFKLNKNWKKTCKEVHPSFTFTGRKVKGGCAPKRQKAQVYGTLNGYVAVDNKEAFNKFSQTPMSMRFPINFNEFMTHVKFLGSDEGFQWSNRFEYLDDPKLPTDFQEDYA